MRGQPNGFCQCGCGGRTIVAKRTDGRIGNVAGQPVAYIKGHWNKVGPEYVVEDRGFETPCWVWQRFRNANGYGSTSRDGRKVGAHVAYYEARVGLIQGGQELDHLCRVRACVNPAHLEPVSTAENQRRSPRARLTPQSAGLIKASSFGHRRLAQLFGVHRSTVRQIRQGRAWVDVPPAAPADVAEFEASPDRYVPERTD